MSFGCYELGDCMGESGVLVDVENWKRILSIVHASSGENDGYEMNAGVVKEWCSAGCGKKL